MESINQNQETLTLELLDWEKHQGLVPAVIQNAKTFQVLMLGMMSKESLRATFEDGLVTFYSRSRDRLWRKGETSGNFLKVVEILSDCDHDCLLVKVIPEGPTCHRQTISCFGNGHGESDHDDFLKTLESLIVEHSRQILQPRAESETSLSYTRSLLRAGTKRCAQKVGEEAVETALAAVAGTDEELISEAADLIYHLLVTLVSRQTSWDDVIRELAKRNHLEPKRILAQNGKQGSVVPESFSDL